VAVGQDARPVPRSLVWATDVDVLPLDRVVERKEGYLLVRSPGNPGHWWGNLLLFDRPPGAGDAHRWERLFEAEFGDEPRVRHRTFAWDRTDGAAGSAREEFLSRGYELDELVGLVAERGQMRAHRRENREVLIRALEPAPGTDEELWHAVVELQVANRDPHHAEQAHRAFARARQDDLRELFRAGYGAWYVAVDPASGDVAGSCGVVVTGERGRFQAVDTALAYRRRGICSRLVVKAAQCSAAAHGAERFVIVADVGYHALGLYESLGFSRREHVFGVCCPPDDAA
jgi:ribosomal protein S18 acetylase RimI-like enzyme